MNTTKHPTWVAHVVCGT